MSQRIDQLSIEINVLKDQMGQLWESKHHTDEEILALAGRIDNLLNEYDHLMNGH